MKWGRLGSHNVHPVAELFPLMEDADLRALAEDIRANGLRSPVLRVWIDNPTCEGTRDPVVLDGRNRLRACELAKVQPDFADYAGPIDTGSLIALARSLNMARRHLDESQRALVASRAIGLYEAEAAERRAAGNARGGARGKWKDARKSSADVRSTSPSRKEPSPPSPPPDRAKASDRAAADFGVSPRLIEHARSVERNGHRDVQRAVARGELKVSAAAELAKLPKARQAEVLKRSKGKPGTVRALVRQHERRELGAQLDAAPLPPPTGPFRVIVADPPWKYDLRDEDATHRGVTPYPPMPTSAICALPIRALAHDDAVLWMWTTNGHLLGADGVSDALEVVKAWGFAPKALLTWTKDRLGLGTYLRNKTEHCILAIRGKPTITLASETTILEGSVREHSRKPESFYELVEAVTPGSKVELFARTPRAGWAVWGAETTKFAEVQP